MKFFLNKTSFLINHFAIVLYLGYLTNCRINFNVCQFVPVLLASIMLFDVSYIITSNVKENKILTSFCWLLILDSWYMVLSLEGSAIATFLFIALGPAILCLSVRFMMMFLFQGAGYQYRKIVDALLIITYGASRIGLFFSDTAFAVLYELQFIVTVIGFLFILIVHHNRLAFVLWSEKTNFLFSFLIVGIGFVLYCILAVNRPYFTDNFGMFLPALLFAISVHRISLKEHRGIPLGMIFSKRQAGLLSISIGTIILVVAMSCNCNCMGYLMLLNVFIGLLFLCNIMLAGIANQTKEFPWKQNTYQLTLKQVQQEEELKANFSNYLHDDVLQDLLSVKNMMEKSERPEIHKLILETLTQLNITIRKQMQDYHPVMLKNLTMKENYQNLIEATQSTFLQKRVIVSFDCTENVFLVAPYHLIVYRFIKELLTNAYKHSDGSHVWITLLQKKEEIELSVCDNGSTKADNIDMADNLVHKGIFSIREQVKSLNGAMLISDNLPHGICIRISIPMKGDESYEYFIGR